MRGQAATQTTYWSKMKKKMPTRMLSSFLEEYSFEKVIVMLQYYDQSRNKCCSWIYFYERKTKANYPEVPNICSFNSEFVQELLFEKINQTLHSVFHPISGQLLSDGMVTFLFQCRKITNFISLSAFCQGTSINLKPLVILKAYKWITNWIKFHSRKDTIYFNVLLSY